MMRDDCSAQTVKDVHQGSVEATKSLRAREGASEEQWRVVAGSILEIDAWAGDEQFDLVYAWGSLHHSGNTSLAVSNTLRLMKPGGRCFLALYAYELYENHLDWVDLKRQYAEASPLERKVIAYAYIHWGLRGVVEEALADGKAQWSAQHGEPVPDYISFQLVLRTVYAAVMNHTLARGMDLFTDATDWVGGYPMEWVETVDLCRAVNNYGYGPVTGPNVGNGMLTMLVGPPEQVPQRELLIKPFGRSQSGCWHAPLPVHWPAGPNSPLVMFEDDGCLGAPHGDQHLDFFCVQRGRYEHREGGLFFMTSDGSNPNHNGRNYSIVIPDSWRESDGFQ